MSSTWAFTELYGLLLSLPDFSLLVRLTQYFGLMGCWNEAGMVILGSWMA